MKKLLFSFLVTFALVGSSFAQTNPAFTTTNSTALTATQTTIPLTAVTSTFRQAGQGADTTLTLAAGWGILIDGEYMVVAESYVSGLQVPVLRGQLGTVAKAHVDERTAILGPPGVFSTTTPGMLGSQCPSAPAQYLVMVQTTTGNVWLCRWIASVGRIWTATNSALLTYNSITVR